MGINLNLECQKLGAMLNRMEGLINATSLDGRERLFKFCETPGGRVLPTDHATGEKNQVPLEKVNEIPCDKYIATEVGTFHTHPNGDARPSISDILFHIIRGSDAFCIGARRGGKRSGSEGGWDIVKNVLQCYRFNKEPAKLAELRSIANSGYPIEKKIIDEGIEGNADFVELYEKLKPIMRKSEDMLEICEMLDARFGSVERIVGARKQ